MFLTIKKYDLITCALAVILSVITFNYIKEGTDTVITSTVPVSGKVIVIDAGHGYPDGGAVGISGASEKELNLSVSFKLQNLLEKSGASVLLTRADDNAVVEDLDKKIKELKREDLKNRNELKNNSNCDAFVSIHMNKYTDSRYSGAQVFCSKEPSGSRILGEKIQASLKAVVDPSNNRTAKTTDGNIFILKDSKVPSVIVECGFLSNSAEEELLQQEAYQEKLAFAIYSGIMDFMNTQK